MSVFAKAPSAPTVQLLNACSPIAQATAHALQKNGYVTTERPASVAHVHHMVVFPWRGTSRVLGDVSINDMLDGMESVLAHAASEVRSTGLNTGESSLRRIVLVSGWEAHGGSECTENAASMGAMLGLARSWALEFSPLGITVNAIIPGPQYGVSAELPTSEPVYASSREKAIAPHGAFADELAYAIACFLDDRAARISGQVLAICDGRTPATIPI